MGATSKGGGPSAPNHLKHDLSTCSTQVRDDLAEGSLSHLASVEDEFAGLEGGGSLFTSCSSPRGRQPVVLLRLKRLASKGGHLSRDGKERVQKEARQYDLLVEPGGQSFAACSSRSAFLEPGGPGYMPWLCSLRPRRALMPKRKQQVPPLQLVALLPRSPRRPGSKRAPRRARVPKLPGTHHTKAEPSEEPAEPLQGTQAVSTAQDEDADVFDLPTSRASSGSPFTLLPATLDAALHEEELEWLSGGQDDSISSTQVQYSWTVARATSTQSSEAPQSLGTGRIKGLKMPQFDRSVSRGSSSIDRSWARASSNVSTIEKVRGKTPAFLNQRTQIREMSSTMLKTMTSTFPRTVWSACGVLHPEEEIEMVRAAEAKVVEDQIDQFKGLAAPVLRKERWRRNSDTRRSSMRRRSFGLGSEHHTEKRQAEVAAVERLDEKVLAHLAKQTGWSVLDVEEVWDVFCLYAVGGRIGVGAPEFISLVQDLYDGVTDDEIMLLQQHITAVRKRNHARNRYMRRAMTGLDGPERSDVRFSEFYVALVKWLKLQQSRLEARDTFKERSKQRCSLSRFADGSSLKAQPQPDATLTDTPAGFMNLDEFRRLKKEVTDSFAGPGGSPRGIGQRMMEQKQKEKHRKRKESSDSEATSDSQDDESDEEQLQLNRTR